MKKIILTILMSICPINAQANPLELGRALVPDTTQLLLWLSIAQEIVAVDKCKKGDCSDFARLTISHIADLSGVPGADYAA